MTVDGLPKICVILGAGASWDINNGSAPILNSGAYKPPLARDLFDIEKHPDYFKIIQDYPDAQTLAGLLSPLSGSKEFNLENKLYELANSRDERVRRQFKQIPPYLRDLIWHASYEYTQTPGTYLQLLYTLLSDHRHNVLFLVLNYDTLLEQALTRFDRNFRFTEVKDYVRADRQAKVVKLHGSINWFKLIGGTSQTWHDLVETLDITQRTPDNAIYVENRSKPPLWSVEVTANRVYPILTAPLAGKSPADMVCPEDHIETARSFLRDCRKFLVIGTSGLDGDLLAFLDQTVSPSLRPSVFLVGKGDGEEALTRFERGVKAFRGGRSTPPGYLFTNGLRPYIDTGGLTEFARFDPLLWR